MVEHEALRLFAQGRDAKKAKALLREGYARVLTGGRL
jgi:hypothetical protein